MTFLAGFSTLLQVVSAAAQVAATPAVPPSASPQTAIATQMGVRITPDTVTVGDRFIAVIKVRAPRGATITFPLESDSAASKSLTSTELIGRPVVQSVPDTAATTMTAAYRLSAWDIGAQSLSLGNIVVRLAGQTGYVPITQTVFVRSVLPADSTLRIPKPPRAPIVLTPFNWLPWIMAAAALIAAGLLWRLWVWYRSRKSAPLSPFAAAEREFARIEGLKLVPAGEGESHAALMSDVMREYLAARIPGIERSQTSAELLARATDIHAAAGGLGELLWRTDLIKFANIRIEMDEADKLGLTARSVVRSVEEHLVAAAREDEARKAA